MSLWRYQLDWEGSLATAVQTRRRQEEERKMNVNERIARYMAATPAAISGNHGHPQTFKVACDLVNGWSLPPLCALTWLRIYNQRCQPRWTLEELQHKIDDAVNADHGKPRGHLLGVNGGCPRHELRPSTFVRVAPKFDREAFRRFVADHAHPVDAKWLIEHSPIAPASQTPANFLGALFEKGERVMIFDAVRSAGSAIATLVCKSERAKRETWKSLGPLSQRRSVRHMVSVKSD
jgi:hypothetical protein